MGVVLCGLAVDSAVAEDVLQKNVLDVQNIFENISPDQEESDKALEIGSYNQDDDIQTQKDFLEFAGDDKQLNLVEFNKWNNNLLGIRRGNKDKKQMVLNLGDVFEEADEDLDGFVSLQEAKKVKLKHEQSKKPFAGTEKRIERKVSPIVGEAKRLDVKRPKPGQIIERKPGMPPRMIREKKDAKENVKTKSETKTEAKKLSPEEKRVRRQNRKQNNVRTQQQVDRLKMNLEARKAARNRIEEQKKKAEEAKQEEDYWQKGDFVKQGKTKRVLKKQRINTKHKYQEDE